MTMNAEYFPVDAENIAGYFGHLWASHVVRRDDGFLDVAATTAAADAADAVAVVHSMHPRPVAVDSTATGRYAWKCTPTMTHLTICRDADQCRSEVSDAALPYMTEVHGSLDVVSITITHPDIIISDDDDSLYHVLVVFSHRTFRE